MSDNISLYSRTDQGGGESSAYVLDKERECRLCGNRENNKKYYVREMMFGSRDVFGYFQCGNCELLQIENYPDQVNKYYPDNYYAHQVDSSCIRKLLVKLRDDYVYKGKGLIGRFLDNMYPNPALRSILPLHIDNDTKVLDVGCGSGGLLRYLCNSGFKNLLGVDPYISGHLHYGNTLKIEKKEIYDIRGEWDIVMFHHSLEHMPCQAAVLTEVSKLLSRKGTCIIRIPVVSSYAWEHYGVNWVQIDAPRHYYLHSEKSVGVLADMVGLELFDVVYDSNVFQFWGSEQYMRDIPQTAKNSYSINRSASIFSRKEMAVFAEMARDLNLKRRGDQAVFYLRHK